MKEIYNLSIEETDIFCNYGYEWDEPLLEYVSIIAEEYHPSNRETGQYISLAINDFAFRYLRNRVNRSCMSKYLENTDIQQTIESMGYDVNKFWYLLMFIYDYSLGYCSDGVNINESPKEQVSRLIKGIAENISAIDEYDNPIFIKPAQLIFKISNKKIIIDNQIAIAWIEAILSTEFKEIENGSKMATSITPLNMVNGLFKYNNPKSNAIHIWYFATMFLKFFKLKPPELTMSKKMLREKEISTNKHLLLTRLLDCIGLLISKKDEFGVKVQNDDTINGYLKQYKNSKIDTINGFYF